MSPTTPLSPLPHYCQQRTWVHVHVHVYTAHVHVWGLTCLSRMCTFKVLAWWNVVQKLLITQISANYSLQDVACATIYSSLQMRLLHYSSREILHKLESCRHLLALLLNLLVLQSRNEQNLRVHGRAIS